MKMKSLMAACSLFVFSTIGGVAYAETWSITEGVDNEWVGQWKRQGHTNRFSCYQRSSQGGSLKATIIVTEHGQTVSAQKINSTDGNNCNYSGIRNGNAVEGTYYCGNGGPYNWYAHISSM